jgi:predicted regulator of Ras-like GTPase activity (Roadblock/LC7/MglB family)
MGQGVSSGVLMDELKSKIQAVAVALVSGDGRILGTSTPTEVYSELFAMMCATIAGAANTVSSELRRTPPDHIVIRGQDFTTVLARYGTGRLLVTVVGPSADLNETVAQVDRFISTNARSPQAAAPGLATSSS